jgi:non-canonical purine NTP pyrophosphatase (RdgB/HAM1 family)
VVELEGEGIEMKPTLITGNMGKLNELRSLLGIELDYQKIDLTEIQATDVAEVAEAKAKEAYGSINTPVIVDDTALTIKSWGSLPGALIKWFIDNVGTDGIAKTLNGAGEPAYVETALAYCDKSGVKIFTGRVEGTIADMPRGENGFGYDDIFIPHGCDKTFAEMTSEEKSAISMRAIAARKLKEFLEEND